MAKTGPKPQPIIDRFNVGYTINENGCWIWQRSLSGTGYGSTSVPGKKRYRTVMAHRLSYELFIGKIPIGNHIHHTCGEKRCVNPEHLKLMKEKEHNGLHDNLIKQKEKTHCPYGHPYRGHNLILNKKGYRWCRICRDIASREYNRKKYSHCPQGHAYTKKNTRYTINGRRRCIACGY